MEVMIRQHLYCPGNIRVIHREVTKSAVCQRKKRSIKKRGKLPHKLAKETPWKNYV